jgi:hypothetical protein
MDWIIPILQQHGLAGVVIAVLGYRVYRQDKIIVELNESRLKDSVVVVNALNANTNATLENAKATSERNGVTQDLAEAIAKQAGAFDVFLQKADFHQNNAKDILQVQAKALEAFAESNRVNSGYLRDIRDHIEGQRE